MRTLSPFKSERTQGGGKPNGPNHSQSNKNEPLLSLVQSNLTDEGRIPATNLFLTLQTPHNLDDIP
jgi:hypothetical protein